MRKLNPLKLRYFQQNLSELAKLGNYFGFMHLCETQISKLHHLELGPSSSNLRYKSELLNARQGDSRPVLASELSWQRICPQCRRHGFDPRVRKIHWRRERLPTPEFLGFPGGSAGKESTCNEGDLGSIPGSGRSPGEGKATSLQYSGLENSMDCRVHGGHKGHD